MIQKGDTISLTLTDTAENDRLFGRFFNGESEGIGVFVRSFKGEKMAIGDLIEAEVLKVKKNYLEASLSKLISASPNRVKPTCAHFGFCGGCKWQHLNYAEQLRQKEKQVIDALIHIGGFSVQSETQTNGFQILPAVAAASVFNYRNKIEFSFAESRFLLPSEMGIADLAKSKDFALGFHAPERFDKVIDIDRCDIATEEMNTVLTTVKNFSLQNNLTVCSVKTYQGFLRNLVIRQAFATGEIMVNLVTSTYEEKLMQELSLELQSALKGKLTTFVNNISTRHNTVAFGEKEYVIFGKGVITEKLGDYQFNISANSFFQTNTNQAESLYAVTKKLAGLKSTDTVYDLYCGTGSISIFISGECQKVFGIELVESSIQDANRNAERNQVKNCTFKLLDLKDFEKIVPELNSFGKPDVVITDPPRAGMHTKAVETILKFAPKRIIYVSCNPASLARDGKLICASGDYELKEVQAVDMFPHTNHVESVARFERLSSEVLN